MWSDFDNFQIFQHFFFLKNMNLPSCCGQISHLLTIHAVYNIDEKRQSKGEERRKACCNRSWNAKASAASTKAYGPDTIKSSCHSPSATNLVCMCEKKDVRGSCFTCNKIFVSKFNIIPRQF